MANFFLLYSIPLYGDLLTDSEAVEREYGVEAIEKCTKETLGDTCLSSDIRNNYYFGKCRWVFIPKSKTRIAINQDEYIQLSLGYDFKPKKIKKKGQKRLNPQNKPGYYSIECLLSDKLTKKIKANKK